MERIAIIGCALRTPGASNAEAFWRMLLDKRRAISTIPRQRWDVERLLAYFTDEPRVNSLRWGGLLDGIDKFDPEFFNITPAEARSMDPQQRLILELGYLCAENAGLTLAQLQGSRTGVYVGISSYDYNKLVGRDFRFVDRSAAIGTSHFAAPNRLSWFMKLKGPSVAADAACASSLVALHQACHALTNRDIDIAMVGGVNAILTPDVMISFMQSGLLSQDGHCRVFDARADGYVRAEACGVVAAKRLADAHADGDRILGVVRGVKLTQTGVRQSFIAPSGIAQEEVMRTAWEAAEVTAAEIGYIEAHATGTFLGDAVELTAIQKQLKNGGRTEPCIVGSYKPNIGYPEAASGIVSLIKVLKMFEHNRIPGQLDYETLNHALADAETLKITSQDKVWGSVEKRIAGLNAFGVGGTYAHVVIEEPDAVPSPLTGSAPLWLLPVSAKTPASLQKLAARYAETISSADDNDAGQYCRIIAVRRNHFSRRHLIFGVSAQDLVQQLLGIAACEHDASIQRPRKRNSVVVRLDGPAQAGVDFIQRLCSAIPGNSVLGNYFSKAVEYRHGLSNASANALILSHGLVCGLTDLGIMVARVELCGEWAVAGVDTLHSAALASLGELAHASPSLSVKNGAQPDNDLLSLIFEGTRVESGPSLGSWFHGALAAVYEAGVELDWASLWNNDRSMLDLELPAYEFNLTRHWVESLVEDVDCISTTT